MAPLIRETDSFDMDLDGMSVSSAMSLSSVAESDKPMSTVQATTTTTKVRKAVHFNEDVEVHYVMNRGDYTFSEISTTFYNRVELSEIKARTKSEVKLLEYRQLAESNEVSTRGLEARTTEGLRRKRRNRADAYTAVFDELDKQDEQGFSDDDILADIYFRYSEEARLTAEMLGLRDARLVREITEENLKTDDDLFPRQSVLACLPDVQNLASSAAA